MKLINRTWFVFSYIQSDPNCLKLRTIWIEVAKLLDSIIAISAINCAEDKNYTDLCYKLGFKRWPEFVIFRDQVSIHISVVSAFGYKVTAIETYYIL